MKDISYQEMQSIEAKKFKHPTGTLTTTFHKPEGEENMYVGFVYGPQKIFNKTQEQVLGSMDAGLINVKKQFNNHQRKYYY